MNFTRAIVRPPAANFAAGLTSVDFGLPDYDLALQQHERYCQALETCGLALTRLPLEQAYPDSTFVEDVAILTPHGALLTRPGAPSRAGEVDSMRPALAAFYPQLAEIMAPGCLDGGDICEAGSHFFLGISARTNPAGAEQLAAWLNGQGYSTSLVDIRSTPGILHLKSGIAWLGERRLALIEALAANPAFAGWEIVNLPAGEEYAANCVRIHQYLLLAAGYPRFETRLKALGYKTLALDMSEYRKMDGGLSCLSLRF